MTTTHRRLPLEYVVCLRWSGDEDFSEFTGSLEQLSRIVDVTVVDGSVYPAFGRHAAAWNRFARHQPVGQWPGRNRKVARVVTGVLAAEIVRPQNVCRPLAWHARWDTAGILLNRAFGSDYPGTLGARRSTFVAVGGYDGDVVFGNLQLIATITAAGGREDRAHRDFAQPARLAAAS